MRFQTLAFIRLYHYLSIYERNLAKKDECQFNFWNAKPNSVIGFFIAFLWAHYEYQHIIACLLCDVLKIDQFWKKQWFGFSSATLRDHILTF